MSIKVLIVDDHKIVRDGLRILIDKQNDMKVVAEAEDGQVAIKLAKRVTPDIIIMDITMPGMNGIDATRQIISENPAIKVIALSMHSDKRFVTGMLEAGASGYLLKDCAFNELAGAIRRVSSNHLYISPGIPDAVASSVSSNPQSGKPATLTKREGEILRLLADGKTTRQIAAVLKISSSTIQTHIRNIMLKLDLSSTAELIKYALKEGIISIDK